MQSSPPISQPPSSSIFSQQESLPVEATLAPLQPATDCQNEKEGMIQLVKPFDVWIKVADYMAIRLKGNKGLSFMLNKALSILFSLDELRSGCAVGGRPRAFNKENDAESVPLDNNRLSAIKAFLTSYCDRMETKTKKKQERLTEKDINSIINTKCSGARRKYKQLQTK
ncbi:hypothetical protein BSL78_10773 [Apostichopus japonicus]|uniref:BEN domain-containing protein n=1 Tax=Stichopus japonicus TaxID=307972 RepID=A0A2G8KWF7_STIJA|nr:hypothetical protein BSL78_10773 [Apostichopus japonicus]